MNNIIEAHIYVNVKSNPKYEPIFSCLLKKKPILFEYMSYFAKFIFDSITNLNYLYLYFLCFAHSVE